MVRPGDLSVVSQKTLEKKSTDRLADNAGSTAAPPHPLLFWAISRFGNM